MNLIEDEITPQERYDDGVEIDAASLSRMWNVLDQSVAEFNHGHRIITLYPCPDSGSSAGQKSEKDLLLEEIS